MEIMLIFVAGFVVFIIAIFSTIKIIANRVTAPTENLKAEITTLKKRVDELEGEQSN